MKNFKLLDNLLVQTQANTVRPVLPLSLVTPLCNLLHFSHASSHCTAQQMTRKINENYYHPSIKAKVKEFSNSCAICASYATKPFIQTDIGEMSQCPPRSRWYIDIASLNLERNETENEYKFFLACVDSASRFCQLFGLKSKSEKDIYSALLKLFSAHMPCHTIKADGESAIASKSLISKLKELGISVDRGCPGRSRGQGIVEYVIGRSKELIRILHRENYLLSIDEILCHTANILNRRIHPQSNVTPEQYFYLYKLPNQDLLQAEDPFPLSEEELQQIQSKFKQLAADRAEFAKNKRDKTNIRRRNPTFEVGDIVFASTKNLIASSTGLRQTTQGPFMVISKDGDFGYVLQKPGSNTVIKRSVDFLIPAKSAYVKGLLTTTWDQEIKRKIHEQQQQQQEQ